MSDGSSSLRAFGLAALVAVAGLAAGPAQALSIQVFTDKTLFEAAAGPLFTETFTGLTNPNPAGATPLTASLANGLSVESSAGSISGDRFVDELVGGNSTHWSFADGTTAFGGIWDLGPQAPGTGITVQVAYEGPNGTVTSNPLAQIPSSLGNDFWGFIADMTIDKVILRPGTGGGVSENYTVDDIVFSQQAAIIPLPGALPLALTALGSLGLLRLRRRRARAQA